MRTVLAVFTCSIVSAFGQWPFPTAEGTTWEYSLTRDLDESPLNLTRRVVKNESGSLRIDTTIDGENNFSQLLQNQAGQILAIANRVGDNESTALDPPATVFPGKFEGGESWNFRGEIAGVPLQLPLKILQNEEVEVPAGKFHAWHIRGEDQAGFSTVVDEWFVPDLGSVKETITQRSPSGDLLTRNTLELVHAPKTAASAAAKPLEASVSTSTAGEPMEHISPGALQIIARWRVHGVRVGTKIRAAWVAEDVGSLAEPEYKVDEATAIATTPDAVGTFTLSRPPDGWAEGRYRVDFYLGDSLADSVKLTIAQ